MSTTDNFPKYYLENVSHIIVSRIPAVVDFIRRTTWDFSIAPAVCFPSAYEIKDKIVAGDIRELPLFLACLCKEYWAVEYEGYPPPLGHLEKYTFEDMKKAGARLTRYKVIAL